MDLSETAQQIRMHLSSARPNYAKNGFEDPIHIEEALKLVADALEEISKKIDK